MSCVTRCVDAVAFARHGYSRGHVEFLLTRGEYVFIENRGFSGAHGDRGAGRRRPGRPASCACRRGRSNNWAQPSYRSRRRRTQCRITTEDPATASGRHVAHRRRSWCPLGAGMFRAQKFTWGTSTPYWSLTCRGRGLSAVSRARRATWSSDPGIDEYSFPTDDRLPSGPGQPIRPH